MTALSDSGLRKVFDQALDYLHRLLPAQSLAFLYGQGDEVRAVRAIRATARSCSSAFAGPASRC